MIAGEVRPSTHMDGYVVNQDLDLPFSQKVRRLLRYR